MGYDGEYKLFFVVAGFDGEGPGLASSIFKGFFGLFGFKHEKKVF